MPRSLPKGRRELDTPASTAFRDASEFFAGTVALIPAAAWESPGLGQWTVRELVAHANRAHTTLVAYVEHPQPPELPGSGYFAPEAVAARGRADVATLGDDPAAAVRAASEAAARLIARSAPETVVGSPAGTVTLARYLPSRTAELAVHSLDLARALGRDVQLPGPVLAETLVFAARRAADRPAAQELLLALTGRGPLPAGYSVY